MGILAVALQGLVRGSLPLGRGGWQRTVERSEQPVLFLITFVVQVFLGGLITHYSLAWL